MPQNEPKERQLTTDEAARLKQLNERIQELANQKRRIYARHDKRDRAADRQRKILVGALVWAKCQRNPKNIEWLANVLREGVEENRRWLFPEIWPDATKPAPKPRNRQDNQAAAATASQD